MSSSIEKEPKTLNIKGWSLIVCVPLFVSFLVFTFFPSSINSSYFRAKEIVEDTTVVNAFESLKEKYKKHFTTITITEIEGNTMRLEGKGIWEAQEESEGQVLIRKIEGVVTLVEEYGISDEECDIELSMEQGAAEAKSKATCKDLNITFEGEDYPTE